MKLNYFAKRLSFLGRWIATTLLCLSAIAFVWQGALIVNNSALASPSTTLIASRDLGDQVQDKTKEESGRAKGFIRDSADQVKLTANRNAARVERASDNDNSFVERKAKRDRDRIEMRAEQDAARTQRAVDNTKNAVERTVDNIKDALN